MKILHVSGARIWGGNEQQVLDMVPELNKLGTENFVLGVKGTPLQEACNKYDIAFIEVKGDKLNTFENYKYLKSVVKELKPDILHFHTSDSLTVYTLSDLLYRLKTKAVFSKKGLMSVNSSILSRYKYNYKNINKIICVSEAVKQSMLDIANKNTRNKLIVLYDGINLNRLKIIRTENIRELFNIEEKKYIIGNIANHARAKDLYTLIKSIDYLVNKIKFNNFHLLQIGKFSEKITLELQNLIKECNIQNYITLVGFENHASDFLPQFDLYVVSSEREGLPLTIYESFLRKTPIVTTKAGGIPEAIEDGYNGYLCEIKDYKTLAEKIKKLLDDPEKMELFAQRSYDLFFEKYTAKINAENTLDVYKSLLNK